MKRLIAFLVLACGLGAAPTTPINNANIQLNGVSQTGVLAGQSTGAATATGAQISTALDLIGSTRGSLLYRGASAWSPLTPGTSGYVLTSAGAGADPVWSPEGSVGTVTTFSAGNLSPLFTTNVATPTTTPALTFSLSTQAANRVFAGPATGADAAPTFRALVTADMPSGTGDVIGPASSTLNAWPLYADTTGKLLKNSDVTYSTPTLTVPAGFGITGAGSLAFTAGGTNQNITLTPSGTGYAIATFNATSVTPAFQGVEVIGKDATNTAIAIDTFGAQSVFLGRRANGTAASPSQLLNGNVITGLYARGYDSSPGYTGAQASLRFTATESWTSTAHGVGASIGVTPNGGTAAVDSMTWENNGRVLFGGSNKSMPAWGTSGVFFRVGAGEVVTDNSSSGTVATAVANNLNVPTFAASSATTFTNAANLYIAGDVAAGTNVTLTNSYGLWNAGKTRLDGAVQLPSTNTSGLQLYNTTDQTTNYERLEALWSSNLATIRTTRGGTGTSRSLELRAVQNGIAFNVAGASVAPAFDLNYGSRSETSVIGVRINGGSTATSGTHVGFSITPTYNQASGTAANTDLLINRTETAVGSGAQYWEDRQVGSVSRMATGSAKVLTTDATVTTIQTYTIPASTTWAFDGYVVARRTGGASGTAEDGASYRVEGVFKNAAGTATSIGSTVTVIGESQAGWDVTVDATGATARIRVTGASGNNISWVWTGNVRQVSS